jgi:putative membrane protein
MTDRILSAALLVALVFALALPGYSQSNSNQAEKDRNPQTNTRANADALTKAIEINVAEIEAGKMASGKAENARVKEFAEMMVKDHTDALTKLRAVNGAPSDVKPNAKHQQTADRLSKLSGAAFDREYIRVMVNGHQEALKFFEQQSNQAQSDLSGIAKELVPAVRHHLSLAQETQRELQGSPTSTKTSSNPNSDQRAKTAPNTNPN